MGSAILVGSDLYESKQFVDGKCAQFYCGAKWIEWIKMMIIMWPSQWGILFKIAIRNVDVFDFSPLNVSTWRSVKCRLFFVSFIREQWPICAHLLIEHFLLVAAFFLSQCNLFLCLSVCFHIFFRIMCVFFGVFPISMIFLNTYSWDSMTFCWPFDD